MSKKIAVVLVNYNGITDTLECIDSLNNSSVPVDIIVVDNASIGEDINILTNKRPSVKLISSEINLGFSGGNNLGIEYALECDYEFILLLNNDTIVDQHMIRELLKHSNFNSVSAPIMYYEGSERIWYGGGGINKFTGNSKHYTEISNGKSNMDGLMKCSFATGCCMLIHRDIFSLVGKWDESFFMYYEDTDFSIRLNINNVNINFVPTAKLWHKISQSTGGETSPFNIYYMTRNRLNIVKKHKSYFYFTAYFFSLVTRYIRMLEHRLLKKDGWKSFKKAIVDHRKQVYGKADKFM